MIPVSKNRDPAATVYQSVLGGTTMVVALLVSMFLVFNIVIGDSKVLKFTDATLVAAVLLIFCLGCIIYSIFSRSIALPEILVVYFISVSAAFSGVYEIATDYFPWPKVHSEADMIYASILYFLFLLFFLVGNRAGGDRGGPAETRVQVEGPVWHVILCLLAVSLACMLATGGAIFSPRAGGDAADVGGASQFALIGKGISLTCFLFLLADWLNNRRRLLLLLAVGLFTLIWFNPIANPRFQFIGLIIAVSSISGVLLRPSPFIRGGIFTSLFFLNYFVFGPLKSLNEGVGEGGSVISAFGQGVSDYAYRVDFDIMQVSANTIQYVRSVGVDYGYNLLGAFLFFVPRAIWPSKPVASSIYVHEYLRYEYINLSSPLPMEFYFAGGVVGVVVLSFIFGFILRRLSYRATRYSVFKGLPFSCILLALVCGYMPIMMRGSLNSVLPQFGFALIAYLAVSLAESKRRRPFKRYLTGAV